MALSFEVKNGLVILKKGSKKIDTVGAWETDAEAEQWAEAICAKYNAPEYADVEYPNDLPDVG